MSQTNKLFHICHVMFSNGITKPEMSRTLLELEGIIEHVDDYDMPEIMKDLIEQGYVGEFEEKYFLLGKGIIAVAAIFT
ncbi:MAG: hypothetical protein KGD59_03945 [Candidatus Heimdallarchaeota archaeon]|nr:hypothetical protein [Candidatus Heimdallarchaeota archaeon]MBY8993677.1 hypothetical protein [Candidatus Heimdallarchaeota archaeon]